MLKDKLIIQFRVNNIETSKMQFFQWEECPSLMFWFRKDALKKVAWSLPTGCIEGQQTALPNWNLAGDWIRYEDSIVDVKDKVRTWRFVGLKNFEEEDLTKYGFPDYKYIRIFSNDPTNNNKQAHEIYDIKAKYWD